MLLSSRPVHAEDTLKSLLLVNDYANRAGALRILDLGEGSTVAALDQSDGAVK